MYEIKLSKQIRKFLEKHKWKWIISSFRNAIIILYENPYSEDLDLKPIRWLHNNFRLRIWKYRFLYEIKDFELEIYFYKWWSRWDVYK